MELQVAKQYRGLLIAQEAEQIVQNCVHCGFCNATCPTYQLLGDELDGPRGRIYLMKGMLEGHDVSRVTQRHLDRCLTCRACETTCPSGVRYGRLLEIGRSLIEREKTRSWMDRLMRMLLRNILSSEKMFRFLFGLGQIFRPVLPSALAQNIPSVEAGQASAIGTHSRRMLLLAGCVQPTLAPLINSSATRVLDIAGISAVTSAGAGCCGALSLHLGGEADARKQARTNIDAWWPEIENGCEAIVMTASGCGVTVKEYGQLLVDDKRYAKKAEAISIKARDLSEVIHQERPKGLREGARRRVAFHSPCTLQHGQGIRGVVEDILESYGWQTTSVRDQHMCCGSAGTYSILQPGIASQLREAKLAALREDNPEVIASANIGCLLHMQKVSEIPVRHWVELLDPQNSHA